MRTVIHAGFAKTGSTSLQNAVFAKCEQIQYLGRPYDKSQKCGLPDLSMRLLTNSDSLTDSKIFDELRQKFSSMQPVDGKVRVISDESITSASRADRALIASRLKEVFGSCDFLFVIRDQITAIPSRFHHECVKNHRMNTNINEWVDDAFANRLSPQKIIKQYDYYAVIKMYQQIFPESKIKVLKYEDLQRMPKQFSIELSNFLSIDNEITSKLLIESEIHNKTSSMRDIICTKKFQLFVTTAAGIRDRHFPFVSRLKFFSRIIKTVAHSIIRLSASNKLNSTRLTEESKKKIEEYFHEGNSKLSKEFNLSLDKFGYGLRSFDSQ